MQQINARELEFVESHPVGYTFGRRHDVINVSRRSFLQVARRNTPLPAAMAAVPLRAESGRTGAAGIGNQTLRGFVRVRPSVPPLPLPIDRTGSPGGIYRVVYSAAISSLLVGDTLEALAELQGVNHTATLPGAPGTNVYLGTWVSLMTSATRMVPSPALNESYLCRPGGASIMSLGSNVGNRFGVPARAGTTTVPTAGTWHVNVIAFGLCNSTSFSGLRNDLLSVIRENGQLTVMHFR